MTRIGRIGLIGLPAVLAIASGPGGARPGVAHADRREASLHAHAIGGIATLADPAAAGARAPRASTPLAGLAARASYATHNHFQYDAALAVLATTGARFATGTFTPAGRPPVTGPFTVASQLARLDAGVTLRLGVAWIPTVRFAGGLAVRRHGAPALHTAGGVVSGPDATGRRAALAADLSAAVSFGVDHRIDRRLVVGVAVGGAAARSLWASSSSSPSGGTDHTGATGALRSFEATVHAAYYWYPR